MLKAWVFLKITTIKCCFVLYFFRNKRLSFFLFLCPEIPQKSSLFFKIFLNIGGLNLLKMSRPSVFCGKSFNHEGRISPAYIYKKSSSGKPLIEALFTCSIIIILHQHIPQKKYAYISFETHRFLTFIKGSIQFFYKRIAPLYKSNLLVCIIILI